MKYLAVVGALLLVACGPNGGTGGKPFDRDMAPDFSNMGIPCPTPKPDTDGDGISDHDEGADENPPRDTDGDGIPDYQDSDSDGDGIPDALEGRNGNTCTPPVDTDEDGTPDFRDLDSDSPTNTTVGDKEEAGPDPTHPLDTDGDGIPDYADIDNDGDGINDLFELTPQGQAVAALTLATAPDTDGDGVPDFLDDDSDGDTIADKDEGIVDTDGDLIPNYRDLDSDGDCVPDAQEAGDATVSSAPVDTDGDGAPDFEDRDSDNDGLTDDKEDKNCNGVLDTCETNRLLADTDADGVNDLIEYQDCAVKTPQQQTMLMCQCDGTNPAASPLTHGDFVFIVDYNTPPTPMSETLNLSTDVSQADVIFSVDSTGSMSGSLNTLAATISSTIIPGVKAKVKSAAFGLLDFKDMADSYVIKYRHRIQTVNTNAGVTSIQGAFTQLQSDGATGGGDSPEAGWQALYSIAGGPAISVGIYNSVLPLATTQPAPATAGETQGTVGGAGFRAGSVPIIVAVTDAEFHDAYNTAAGGENGLNDYASTYAGTPSRATTMSRLQAIGAHVIGLAGTGGGSSGNPKARAIANAQDTGAVVTPADFGPVGTRPASCSAAQCCTGQNGAGEAPIGGQCPLGYTFDDASGNGVSSSVIDGIAALANGLKFDIHVQAQDVDPGTVDNFMLKLVPNLTGMAGASMCITMTPSPLQDNFTGPKATGGADGTLDTFPGIGGGQLICFDVIPKTNTTVMPTDMPQFFRAQLQVKGVTGMNTVNLGTPRDVFFLVPPKIDNGPIK